MLSFYQSLAMVVLTCLCAGALLARRLAGDASIGAFDLLFLLLYVGLSIYMTVDAYKLDSQTKRQA